MTCRFQRGERRLARIIFIVFQAQINEDAILAVDFQFSQRLAFERNQRLTVLAGGFGDQLLGPCAEIGDLP